MSGDGIPAAFLAQANHTKLPADTLECSRWKSPISWLPFESWQTCLRMAVTLFRNRNQMLCKAGFFGIFSKIPVMFQPFRALVCASLLAVSLPSAAADASALKPPAGAKVAVVVFMDLQSPECARAVTAAWEAANAHKVPLLLHDFPLPRHNWAFDAAVWARYFDQKSATLGNDFRKFILANQSQITRENLLQWAQRFGEENKAVVSLPNDADGRLAEKVKSDFALGQSVGVEHSFTLWVVSNSGVSQPVVDEIKDRGQLNQWIEDMLKKAQSEPEKSTPQKAAAAKKRAAKNLR